VKRESVPEQKRWARRRAGRREAGLDVRTDAMHRIQGRVVQAIGLLAAVVVLLWAATQLVENF
jgi:hypothetical protein